MISFYSSILVGALLFTLIRKRIKPLSGIIWFFVGILPVGIDGLTHMINGTSGTGFHDTNALHRSIRWACASGIPGR